MSNKSQQADWDKLRKINSNLKHEGKQWRARMATAEEEATGETKTNGGRVVHEDGLVVVLCPVLPGHSKKQEMP
jgi:hypothetical protein